VPESQLFRLASQESQAWSEVVGRPSRSASHGRQTRSISSTALIDTIKCHCREEFQRLIDVGVDVNGADDRGRTPLMHTIFQHDAACNECLKCMHSLLQLNIDIDAANNGDTALQMTVDYNNLTAAKALVKKGALVDGSLLMFAVRSNQPTFVDSFLTSTLSPDLDIADSDDWGLIHHAVWNNSKDILLAVLNAAKTKQLSMKIDAHCSMDWTPLMLLAENADHPRSSALATILLDHDADVNAVDMCGCSALYYAATLGSYSPQRNKVIQLLLERKADVDTVRSKALKGLMDRFPALSRDTDQQRRDSVHSGSEASPTSKRKISFKRRWSRA